MTKKLLIEAFMAIGVLVGTGSLLQPTEAFAQSSATVGSLRGVIKDKSTNDIAIGATVVATSPAMVGEQVVITDGQGQYFITALPPGLYTLTIYYNNQPFSRPGVLIQLGKEAVVNVTVDSATKANTPKGEVIVIKGNVPIIDQGSTKTGVTLTDDYTRNIPTGRTFGGVLGTAAGSQTDQFGTSLSGATSSENVYVVEGINTTDTGFGGISSNLPNEFIAETEVITGGYNAEFGRATGGIINVVTKSGSNQFRGSVFGYYTPGALVASADVIQREGASVDSETNLDFAYDIGAEVGGPIIKDKLWFHVGINPSQNRTTITRFIASQVDNDGDGAPDTDANGFTVRDRLEGSERDIVQDLTTYFFTAKINGAIDQNHQFQVSAFGNPRSGEAAAGVLGNPAFTRFNNEDGAYDVAAKWTSKFGQGKTQIDAVLGFHRGFDRASPLAGQNVNGVASNRNRSIFDYEQFETGIGDCQDDTAGNMNDPYPGMVNCPVIGYRLQGFGTFEDRTNDRTSFVLAATQRVPMGKAGYHTFKAGIDLDFATYDSTKALSGGAFLTQGGPNPNLPADQTPRWQLREQYQIIGNLRSPLNDAMGNPIDVDMNGVPDAIEEISTDARADLCINDNAVCLPALQTTAETNNTSLAAFIQDQWQILPNFTLNLGVRWEQQTGYVAKNLQGLISPDGEVIPEAAFKLENMIAPRLGFIFDPTKEGKSKVYGHYGRFYENVPMDINVRAFGGEITNFTFINPARRSPGDPMFDPACNVDITNRPAGTDLAAELALCDQRARQAQLGGGTEFVSPGMKGQYTEEWILGAEYQLIPDLKVGLSYIHRSLPQVIEDISTNGGNSYIITNPSGNFDGAAADLRREVDQILMDAGCSSLSDTGAGCDQSKLALAALQNDRAGQMEFIKNFDKPTRFYDAIQLTVNQRPTKQSLVQASYTYSVSKGNYPGLFSTETGQLDPNLTSLYDLPDLMANRYGPMGLDRPHNIKIDGFYQFDLKKGGVLTTGASFRAISGIAHNALAAHPVYGDQESYLLPRGAMPRSPVTFQTDLHLSYGYRVSKNTTIEGFVRFFNILNAQEELDSDEEYTTENAVPVVGGDQEDLKHVKTIDFTEVNATPLVNPNFGNLNNRQAPRQVQLGFRVTF